MNPRSGRPLEKGRATRSSVLTWRIPWTEEPGRLHGAAKSQARYWMLGAGVLGRPREMVRGGRWEEGSGWGTRVYVWWIHVDMWQNQYNIVK